MTRILLSAVAATTLSLLAACGGGDGPEDSAASRTAPAAVADTGGIGGSGVTTKSLVVGGTATPSTGGIGGSGSPVPLTGGIGGSGIKSVRPTQACGLQGVSVTIAGARVNADGAAALDSPGWVDLAVPTPVRADLLRLGAGEPLPLDFSALPNGTYHQIRLLLVAGDPAAPLADAVITDGQESALAVPTAAQGGVPLAATITVAQGQVTASFDGLDACQAVSGTAGTYALNAAGSGATTQVATTY
jgi:hypothetical protein